MSINQFIVSLSLLVVSSISHAQNSDSKLDTENFHLPTQAQLNNNNESENIITLQSGIKNLYASAEHDNNYQSINVNTLIKAMVVPFNMKKSHTLASQFGSVEVEATSLNNEPFTAFNIIYNNVPNLSCVEIVNNVNKLFAIVLINNTVVKDQSKKNKVLDPKKLTSSCNTDSNKIVFTSN